MFLEAATLVVDTARSGDFEKAFERNIHFIRRAPGCRALELRRCIENPGKYLLLIQWDKVEDHTERFRNSPDYREWSTQIGGFFGSGTSVEHYSPQVGEWFTAG